MEAAFAIADPVRREILEMLRTGPRSAGDITAEFTISRPAVSRHLRVLREAGLVVDDVDPTDGRGRVYRLDVSPLGELDAWLSQFRTGLNAALDALGLEVRRTKRERRAAKANPRTTRSKRSTA